MISVLCVRFGTKYGKDYVEKLRNMVKRHLTLPYEFVCLTDDPTPIEGVRLIVCPQSEYPKLWWQKVHMFDPTLPLSGRILYFDLDVVICRNINKLVQSCAQKDFYGIRDFNRKFHAGWTQLNSSVMSWEKGYHPDVWTVFQHSKSSALKLHGDQDWIYKVARSRITFWPDEYIMSYKWELRERSELERVSGKLKFKTIRNPIVPKECCVAVFHGDPNPHDIPDPFVLDNWQ